MFMCGKVTRENLIDSSHRIPQKMIELCTKSDIIKIYEIGHIKRRINFALSRNRAIHLSSRRNQCVIP